jgi:hypothetical protein
MPGGWSLTVVVGLSQVFLSTRALRLPEGSRRHATVGRWLDRPLRRAVSARLSPEEDSRDASGSIVVQPHPAEQCFKPDFPIRLILPSTREGARCAIQN